MRMDHYLHFSPFFFYFEKSFQNGTEFLKSIFRDTNSKKPRHIIQGLWYGMKSALTGSIAALVSVVMKPVLGFKENEWIGLGLGMLSGTLYAVVFTLYGYGQGVYQLYQGLIATPAAIYAAHVGQIWNETSQKYDYYNLDQEANETKSSEYDTNRNVADMTYYNLLQVNTTASSKEIKRAYYRIARDVHPDKNNSKEAGELFRQLHIAYTTLYDEEKRSIYDMYGLTGNANSTNADIPIHFDPHIFFGILFNSQLVEPYIGELTISSFTDHLVHFASHNMNIQVEKMSPGENMNLLRNFMKNNQNQHNRKSLKRQIDIALYLRTQVEPYATGSMSQMEFRNKCRQEAMQILDGNPLFGYQFLHTIGTALTSEAKQFLSIQHFYSIPGFINSIISSIRKVHQRSQRLITSTKKTFAVLRLVAEAYEKNLSNKQINMYSEPSSGAFMQDDELKKLLPALLDMAWSYNTHDISYILHGACKKVFLDYSNINSKYKRLIRAEAIQILGEEFLAQSILYTTNINHKMNSKNNKNADIGEDFDIDDYNEEIFTRLEVAFQISQMKVRK